MKLHVTEGADGIELVAWNEVQFNSAAAHEAAIHVGDHGMSITLEV